MNGEQMNKIQRLGTTQRWSEVVIHRETAYFVEVADDPTAGIEGQTEQVFRQVENKLKQIGSSLEKLLQVVVYLPEPADLAVFNAKWDSWIPSGHAPSRACIHAALVSPSYRVELVVQAAI